MPFVEPYSKESIRMPVRTRSAFREPDVCIRYGSPQTFANTADVLDVFSDQLRDVVIEELQYLELLEMYDSEETVFYLDPPYVGLEDCYPVGNVDHSTLLETVRDLDGKAIVSYGELPAGAGDLWSVIREGEKRINNGTAGEEKDATERLLLTSIRRWPSD